jgi:chemotaxis protein MotB
MTRRRVISVSPHALRASGDRWLFGYADIVTLLFACFASLYAAKLAAPVTADAALKADAPTASAPAVVAPGATATPPATIVAAPPEPSPLERALESVLGRDGNLPGVEVATSVRGLVISLPEAGSFPAGRAELSEAARSVMLDMAGQLRPLPNQIRVEGHTDDVPIHTAQFGSNWELSTARATTVVQFLIEAGGVAASRLAAAGYAEYRPRLPNDSPDHRARNRRVDIDILDPSAATQEPR